MDFIELQKWDLYKIGRLVRLRTPILIPTHIYIYFFLFKWIFFFFFFAYRTSYYPWEIIQHRSKSQCFFYWFFLARNDALRTSFLAQSTVSYFPFCFVKQRKLLDPITAAFLPTRKSGFTYNSYIVLWKQPTCVNC